MAGTGDGGKGKLFVFLTGYAKFFGGGLTL